MDANQEPTYSRNLPRSLSGDGDDAIELASAFFGKPLPWQEYICRVMLARNKQDKYACKVFAMSVPRQNGKSWSVRARCFYGLVCCGEKILFTCQHSDTADEMFKDLSEVFEDEENTELHAILLAVRKANGQQAIYLKNGGYIRFTTRTNSLARGKTYDVLVYDEAQELTVGQQAASLPAISAGDLKNPQTIYLGTPPDGQCAGTVFKTMHDRVHGGQSKAAWLEWSATEIGDVADRSRWYSFNPSLGTILALDAIVAESESMPPDSFARERLGWWDNNVSHIEHLIDLKDWNLCETADPPDNGVMTAAVKFSPDGATCALSVCLKPEIGVPYIECLTSRSLSNGVGWLADWLYKRKDKIAVIAIDGRAGTTALVAKLNELGMTHKAIKLPTSKEFSGAVSMLVNAVNEHQISHYGQQSLTDSATKSAKRNIGSDGCGFESTADADATLIESCALAYWQAMTTKRKPGRKAQVY